MKAGSFLAAGILFPLVPGLHVVPVESHVYPLGQQVSCPVQQTAYGAKGDLKINTIH